MNSAIPAYFHYWGKARPSRSDGGAESVVGCHLLAYHSLDVAAVTERLLARHSALRHQLAHLLRLPEESAVQLLCWLAAIHDIGKFARAFQALRPEVALALGQQAPIHELYYRSKFHHDRLGLWLWHERIVDKALQESWFGIIDTDKPTALRTCLRTLVACSTCHHGEPRDLPCNKEGCLSEHFVPADEDAALAWCRWVRETLGAPDLSGIDFKQWKQQISRASWLLAGVITLADWVGSNAQRFRYKDQHDNLQAYWDYARDVADHAISDFGILPAQVNHQARFEDIFKHIATPSPLQQVACDIALGSGPQLILIEDVTGAGKTEAALALAHRLMQNNCADGLYIGLPTMATANAMFKRLGACYRQFYSGDTQPSLALAHSARHLFAMFRDAVANGSALPQDCFVEAGFALQQEDVNYGNESSASAMCNEWIADSRKKTFFADMAVGTLDQALQSVLPTRHQALKWAGLGRKTLLCDEVHAYDDYTGCLLESLLQFHAAQGGSAIILSATLPTARKAALISAFARGAGAQQVPAPASTAFPLLSHWHTALPALVEIKMPTRQDLAREVQVKPVHSEDEIIALIVSAVSNNQCVCWVRNTVGDVQAAYAQLKNIPALAGKVEIFHARYTLADRLDIEEIVLQRFGNRSHVGNRAGRVLVASQVIEQSLDLDFDQLITDLAPIDLIIQRAGRIHRHRRDRDGNLLANNEADQRGTPTLHLYTPSFTETPDANWLAAFKGTAVVYDNHAVLWRSARLFADGNRRGWQMPQDARDLLKSVYDDDNDTPPGLAYNADKSAGSALAERQHALNGVLKLDDGYLNSVGAWQDDAHFTTRLDGNSGTVWLARWDGKSIKPWRNDLADAPWDYSAINLRRTLFERGVDQPAWASAVQEVMPTLPAQGKFGYLLVLQQDDQGQWYGEGIDSKGRGRRFIYREREGGLCEVGEKKA